MIRNICRLFCEGARAPGGRRDPVDDAKNIYYSTLIPKTQNVSGDGDEDYRFPPVAGRENQKEGFWKGRPSYFACSRLVVDCTKKLYPDFLEPQV